MKTNLQDIIHFWFKKYGPKQWFAKDEEFDEEIREKFLDTYEAATCGETAMWRDTAEGRLAEIIVLDQFGRNMFRGTDQAFADDAQALKLAQDAVSHGADQEVNQRKRKFFYMPYMHSESLAVHKEGLPLFEALEDEETLRYEKEHQRIIEQFGRYPHRNAVLGRESTEDEREFLKERSGF